MAQSPIWRTLRKGTKKSGCGIQKYRSQRAPTVPEYFPKKRDEAPGVLSSTTSVRIQSRVMTETTVKEKVLKAVEKLPADATYEDAMERLYVLYKVERGLRQIEAGEGIPHAEAKKRIFDAVRR